MMQGHEDQFVALVSVLLGLFFIICGTANWQWYYTLRSAQWLQQWLGRGGARTFHVLLGVSLIALGAAIALGYRWILTPEF
jgi:small neutral amino acid transporter SnatA (MarC family)